MRSGFAAHAAVNPDLITPRAPGFGPAPPPRCATEPARLALRTPGRMRAPPIATLLAACLLALAACGDDDSDEGASGGGTGNGGGGGAYGGGGAGDGGGDDGKSAEKAADGGGATTLRLAADPGGALAFDKTTLSAKAGQVTIAFENASQVPHAVEVEGNGVEEETETITESSARLAVDLDRGEYKFYCPVGNHEQAGMVGTLTVR
jgi:plastocyanin